MFLGLSRFDLRNLQRELEFRFHLISQLGFLTLHLGLWGVFCPSERSADVLKQVDHRHPKITLAESWSSRPGRILVPVDLTKLSGFVVRGKVQ